MKLNTRTRVPAPRTHEGATARKITPAEQLTRSVMSCMLWEDEFYESGESIAARIAGIIPKVKPEDVALIAVEAREQMKLRHVPLLIARVMAILPTHKHLVADTLARIIQRPDELSEFLAIYWKDKKQPLSAQVKRGLAQAFTKFNEYSLAKYNRYGDIKLRDVLFLSHAKPENKAQEKLWKKLVDGTLDVPDTWEVALSSGQDKSETFTRLIEEKKLGGLALLRNLRNMQQAGVAKATIRRALLDMSVERILPFRFISAAKHAPDLEPELEQAMFKSLEGRDKLEGHTLLLIDVSGSMDAKVSGKSEISRMDAGAGLAMLLREIAEDVTVMTFSDDVIQIAARRGFALRDMIVNSQRHSGTMLGASIRMGLEHSDPDRLIVISDEQSHDRVDNPDVETAYMLNVASYQNGVGYYGPWTNISGWSESVIDYIQALEQSF